MNDVTRRKILKVASYRHLVKTLLTFSIIPFAFISLLMALPAIIGVSVITIEEPLPNDFKVLEEPNRTFIKNAYDILFLSVPLFVIAQVILWCLWIILIIIDDSLSGGKKKNDE